MKIKFFLIGTEADKKYIGKIKRWSKLSKCGEHQVIFVTKEDGKKTATGRFLQLPIETKIKNCHIVLVLVGNNNNQHPWLIYHRYAIQLKKPIMYIRIPYTTDPIPQRFAYLTQVAFNPNAIEKLAIDYKHRYEQYLLRRQQQEPTNTETDTSNPNDTPTENGLDTLVGI